MLHLVVDYESYDSTTITSLTNSKDTCVTEGIQEFYFDVDSSSVVKKSK